MFIHFKRWLAAPVSAHIGEDDLRTVRLLNAILNAFSAGLPIVFVAALLGSAHVLLPIFLSFIMVQFLRWLMWQGRVQLTSILLVLGLSALITVSLYVLGTIQTPGVSFFILVIIAAGLLMGSRAMMVMIVLNGLAVLGLGLGEQAGLLPPANPATGLRLWLLYMTTFGLTAVFLHLALRDMKLSLARARHEVNVRQEAESRYRLLFESSPEGILIANSQGIIEMSNTAAQQMLGYSEAEFKGKLPQFFLDPVELKERPILYERLSMGKVVSAERLLVRKNGERLTAMGSILRMPDGRFQYIFRDITERKQAEAALALSQKKLQQYADIVTNIQLGLYVFSIDDIQDDRTLRMIDANPTALRISKKKYEDVIGKPIDEIFKTLRGKQFPENYAEVIRTGVSTNLLDAYYEPDGTLRGAFDVKVFPLPHHCVGVAFEDITARIKAEMEQEKLVQELEAKNQELERFTYTVSHDLKSPLVTIRGFLGFLEADAKNGRLDRMMGDIGRIQEAADKMKGLLNDLLELSRIGRLTNPPQPIAFVDLVEEALKLAAGQRQQRAVQVRMQPDLPAVYGDQPRLVEVMQNLLDNAIKFMGDQPQPQIEIGQHFVGDEAVFYVRDNGIGIEPAYQQKIFDLFDRLNPNVEGSGIGLTLVKRIVEVHGGRIWVGSEGVGKGCTFYFVLPLAS